MKTRWRAQCGRRCLGHKEFSVAGKDGGTLVQADDNALPSRRYGNVFNFGLSKSGAKISHADFCFFTDRLSHEYVYGRFSVGQPWCETNSLRGVLQIVNRLAFGYRIDKNGAHRLRQLAHTIGIDPYHFEPL